MPYIPQLTPETVLQWTAQASMAENPVVNISTNTEIARVQIV
jgi:hypothetical protein